MIATIIITALIISAVIAIITNGIKKRKRGECSCSCGCSSCHQCHK